MSSPDGPGVLPSEARPVEDEEFASSVEEDEPEQIQETDKPTFKSVQIDIDDQEMQVEEEVPDVQNSLRTGHPEPLRSPTKNEKERKVSPTKSPKRKMTPDAKTSGSKTANASRPPAEESVNEGDVFRSYRCTRSYHHQSVRPSSSFIVIQSSLS